MKYHHNNILARLPEARHCRTVWPFQRNLTDKSPSDLYLSLIARGRVTDRVTIVNKQMKTNSHFSYIPCFWLSLSFCSAHTKSILMNTETIRERKTGSIAWNTSYTNILTDYIATRIICFSSILLTCGVPQGSILVPILFCNPHNPLRPFHR